MKRKMRILLAAAVLLCLAALLTTSCDRGGAETATDTQTTESAPTEEPTAAPTDPATAAPTEPDTETPTEPATAAPTEPVTEAPTEPVTEAQTIDVEAYMKMDEVTEVTLPDSSSTMSWDLANQLLSLASGYDQPGTAAVFAGAGFEVLTQVHFDKDPASGEHTCAFTIGKKTMTYQGRERTVILTAVRGTNGGEWYSNFDVLPSRDFALAEAENFLLTAKDVYAVLKPILDAETDPLILVCGHSRGAACANLLGTLVNADFGIENVFTYTYATPATVRFDPNLACPNIFNFINPCDVVPMMPLSVWGFGRYGLDIILPGTSTEVKQVTDPMAVLSGTAPTLESYYNDRHSLKGAGLADDGMTVYEVMTSLGKMLADGGSVGVATGGAGAMSGFDMRLLFMSQESDLYPFMQIVMGLVAENGEGMQRVLIRHIPSTYQALMKLERQLEGQ